MKHAETLHDFLYELNWTDTMRHKLRVMAERDDVRYLVAWDNAGRLSASAYTEKPDKWPDTVWRVWEKRTEAAAVKSKTQQAVALVRKGELTPHAAARQLGLHPSAVYRAMIRAKTRPLCPCCGQVVREGFAVDPSALRSPSDGPASA